MRYLLVLLSGLLPFILVAEEIESAARATLSTHGPAEQTDTSSDLPPLTETQDPSAVEPDRLEIEGVPPSINLLHSIENLEKQVMTPSMPDNEEDEDESNDFGIDADDDETEDEDEDDKNTPDDEALFRVQVKPLLHSQSA